MYLKDTDKTKKAKKVGYFRGTHRSAGATIVVEQDFVLKLVSFNKKVDITIDQTLTFAGKAPYRMLGGTLIERAGGQPTKTSFTWNEAAKGYTSVHEVAGQKRTEVIKDIDYTLADDSAVEVWVGQNPKVGDAVRVKSFDLTIAKMETQVNKILTAKESLTGGVKVRFFEVESVAQTRLIKSISRYDDQGNTLSLVMGPFELRRETEAQARNTEYSQDLFVLGMVKIDKAIGRTDKLRELVVAVDGDGSETFEDGPRQSVRDAGKGMRVIRVGKRYGKAEKATPAQIQEALAETNSYPITNPKIKALAARVTAGAKNDEEKVAKLVAFVHGYVKPYLSANAPNVYDLLEQKKGDCKSYALLFNNLARAAGVPAREVSGLLYTGDDLRRFGGHAWNEVVLGGVWVPIDATMGETEVDAGHISFGTEHKANRSMLTSLGKLSFRLVEVKSAP